MCGIAGVYGTQATASPFDLNILEHRGPDHSDSVTVNEMLLGHTRLSIVDVEGGDQPIQSPDGRYWLISNGEIYNHRALRSQFPDYEFQTQTDSEAILVAYQAYGTAAVEHLDGMFAFVIYDTLENTLYMGRDPIGIKPLYYGWEDGALYFASEMKALQHLVDELHEFPPGHWYTPQQGLVKYYDLKEVVAESSGSDAPDIAEIEASLRKAVEKRMMSDVPLGVYLSGGLDSTIVAALVAEINPDVHSFAVGMAHSEDLQNARRAAEMLDTNHHEYVYTLEEMLEALPQVIYHLESFDPSLVRSAIPNYFLARMTRQYVTVVLTGEGADELYAGYHYLKDFEDEAALRAELTHLTNTLYNCNLQRCDRMTMAHSIEARVPFLDTDFIRLSMRVPHSQKIKPGTQVEKWALRKAFDGIVPEHVAWRKKEQFSKGAGSSDVLVQVAEERYDDATYAARVSQIADEVGVKISSKEMLMYYEIFAAQFTPSAARLVRVWVGRDV